jgi:hypothetical protein
MMLDLASAIIEDRVREILTVGAEAAFADSDVPPRPGDVVWYALREGMDTLRRLPDREVGWLYSQHGVWPEFAHDEAERLEAYETMLARIKIGEEPVEALAIRRPPPSARAISRMERVFEWHRYLTGSHRRRDWRVLCQLASGTPAVVVGRNNRLHRNSVYDRREVQAASIARGLAVDFGEGIFPVLVQTGQRRHGWAL